MKPCKDTIQLICDVEGLENPIDIDKVTKKIKEFDDIEESLEVFRTKIYFKSKVEPVERIPVTGRMMNFKDSSDETNS